jgi:predicted Abi (CAAX) family protease
VEIIRGWRAVVPRRAQVRLAEFFLERGAKLWFIQPNQVGSNNREMIPLAPARAFDFNDDRKDPQENHLVLLRQIFVV